MALQEQATKLKDVLATGLLQPERAKLLAKQIAEDLCVAHAHGVSHGELNLSNVVLVGPSSHARAVITGFGADSSVDSDIYAFGMVLDALIPGHRLAWECMAPNQSDRPDCFELVLEELQDLSARRTWIGSLLIAAVTASLFLYELSRLH